MLYPKYDPFIFFNKNYIYKNTKDCNNNDIIFEIKNILYIKKMSKINFHIVILFKRFSFLWKLNKEQSSFT